jgi:hypothetical protein
MMEIDINGIITIIAIVVYVIIFFIQKAQMNSQKEIISSMKTFIDIFSVDEVRKFAEMKEETTLNKATNLIIAKPEIQRMTKELNEQLQMPISEFYNKIMTDFNKELIDLAFMTTMNQKESLREQFIEENFPINKDLIIGMIEDNEKNE